MIGFAVESTLLDGLKRSDCYALDHKKLVERLFEVLDDPMCSLELVFKTPPATNTSHPKTSSDAAKTLTAENMTAVQSAIVAILNEHDALADREIIEKWTGPRAGQSSIRSRRADLVRAGVVVDTGLTRKIGKTSHKVWRLA